MAGSRAGRTMPWSNGAAKNSGKMVIRSKRTLFACVQVAQAIWQRNINAPGGDIDASANILSQRYQQFARSRPHLQKRCTSSCSFSRKENILHRSDHAGSVFHRARRRREFCFRDRVFKDRAANQVADEILAGGEFTPVPQGDPPPP